MRVGLVILPELSWAEAAARWRQVEEWGYHSAWTYDHLSWRTLADGPWHATIPTLTAAATVTSRVRLGTLVTSPNFRHPVPFAKDVMTLDDVSGGRLTLGIGAGGTGFDASVLGQPPLTAAQRRERFAEFVAALDTLLTQPSSTFAGPYYQAVDARMVPGCVQQPRVPFLLAADGPRALDIVVRHGQGWVTTGTADAAADPDAWWRGLRELSVALDDTLAGAGRDVRGVDRVLLADARGLPVLESAGQFADVAGRAGELGFTDVVVHWPRPDGIYAGDPSVLDRIAADVLPGLSG